MQQATVMSRMRRRPHSSLVELAYDAVVVAIFDGRLAPQERVGITALANSLEMSITPVREALTRTAAEGLTQFSPNRGYVVTPPLTTDQFHQLFAVRKLLELAALDQRLELERASPQGLTEPAHYVATLDRLTSRMESLGHSPAYEEYSQFSRADHDFHRALIQLGGNVFIARAWDGLLFHLHISRIYAGAGVVDYQQANEEHAQIAAVLREGNTKAARDAVCRHVDRAEARLIELLH